MRRFGVPLLNQRSETAGLFARRKILRSLIRPGPFSASMSTGRRKCSRGSRRLSGSEMEAHGLTRKQPLDRTAGEPLWQALAAAPRRPRRRRRSLILLLSPLLIAVAIAIRLDSRGPALFRQRRVGYGEREFTLFKFRSMRLDADPRGHREYVTALIKGEDAPTAARKRPLQARRRRPHHPGRALDQALEPRRAAAALQRRRRRHDPGRARARRSPTRSPSTRAGTCERFSVKPGPDRPLAGQRPQRAHLRGNGPARHRVRRKALARASISRSSPRPHGPCSARRGAAVNPAGAIGTMVVGYGYWGPNIVRNVVERPEFRLMGLCELDEGRDRRLPPPPSRRLDRARPRRRARRPADRGGGDRHPAPHPLRPRQPRPGSRQARAGREAAGPHRRGGRRAGRAGRGARPGADARPHLPLQPRRSTRSAT